jgi:hypothetical protein
VSKYIPYLSSIELAVEVDLNECNNNKNNLSHVSPSTLQHPGERHLLGEKCIAFISIKFAVCIGEKLLRSGDVLRHFLPVFDQGEGLEAWKYLSPKLVSRVHSVFKSNRA